MNTHLVLLLTRDRHLEKLLAEALLESGALVLVARNIGDALQIVCTRGRECDFAVIDFANGCHGMTLLSTVNTCRPELPIIVVTSSDVYQATVLVCAIDVAACLAKPVSAAELRIVIQELGEPEPEFAVAKIRAANNAKNESHHFSSNGIAKATNPFTRPMPRERVWSEPPFFVRT